jgi:hypothetical protein
MTKRRIDQYGFKRTDEPIFSTTCYGPLPHAGDYLDFRGEKLIVEYVIHVHMTATGNPSEMYPVIYARKAP